MNRVYHEHEMIKVWCRLQLSTSYTRKYCNINYAAATPQYMDQRAATRPAAAAAV